VDLKPVAHADFKEFNGWSFLVSEKKRKMGRLAPMAHSTINILLDIRKKS
jgi:hypothetical protein